MNIRTKLFIFIPALIILLNLIFFFIFQNSKLVLENNNRMMDQILLYKQATDEADQTIRSLHQFLLKQDGDRYQELTNHQEALVRLKEQLKEVKSRETNTLMLTDFENMLTTLSEQEKRTVFAFNSRNLEEYTYQYSEAEKTVRYIKEQGQNLVDSELSFYQPLYKGILESTNKMNQLGKILFGMTTLLSLWLAVWLSRSITIPINKLVMAAKQITNGDLKAKLPQFSNKTEVGVLAKAFSKMLISIRELMAKHMESLEKDKLVKELELKSLQSQINPHFLFNTLNVLSKLAYIEGAEKTSDLTVSVSNLLRYNLRKLDEPVTLREEVENVKQYFDIQKARFRDRVAFLTEIDEEALNQLVPCLTLQPIIENAFVHGIEGLERGAVIRLCIKNTKDFVTVEIADNGAGMSDEIKNILLSDNVEVQSSSGTSTGLGTKNVFKRLKLFYGPESFIDIRNNSPQGTIVIFHFPHKNETNI